MKNLALSIGVLGLLLLGSSLSAQENKASAGSEAFSGHALARELLRELVAIDTTPAHGSTKAAETMAARLRASGFGESDVMLLGSRSDRQNLVVRLRGSGKAKSILLIAHLDTVDAPREGWSEGLDPFQLTERDGFFYGRGVLDCKCAVASLVATLIRLRAERFIPDRDILVALTADEETGNANGISWLLSNRPSLTDVAWCLNLDAGGGRKEDGKRVQMAVQTSEKAYLSFRLETHSPGGHSSLPERDNAIYRLAEGLVRLSRYEFPFRFNETTRTWFRRLAESQTGTLADDMRAVAQEPPDLEAAKRLTEVSPYYNSLLHTTCVATRVEAGHADNALPQFARAIVNCRVFPGDDLDFVSGTLAEVLADPEIKVTPLGTGRPAPASTLLPEVMGPIEQIAGQMWPRLPVLPVMDPWTGDSARLRSAGIPTFGTSGIFSDDSGNAHGANERLATDAFDESVEFLHRLLKSMTRDGGVSAHP